MGLVMLLVPGLDKRGIAGYCLSVLRCSHLHVLTFCLLPAFSDALSSPGCFLLFMLKTVL